MSEHDNYNQGQDFVDQYLSSVQELSETPSTTADELDPISKLKEELRAGHMKTFHYIDRVCLAFAEKIDIVRHNAHQPTTVKESLAEILASPEAKTAFERGCSGGGRHRPNPRLDSIEGILAMHFHPHSAYAPFIASVVRGNVGGEKNRFFHWTSLRNNIELAGIPVELQGVLFGDLFVTFSRQQARQITESFLESTQNILPGRESEFWKTKLIGSPEKEGVLFYKGYAVTFTKYVQEKAKEFFGDDTDTALNIWRSIFFMKTTRAQNNTLHTIRVPILQKLGERDIEEAFTLLRQSILDFPHLFTAVAKKMCAVLADDIESNKAIKRSQLILKSESEQLTRRQGYMEEEVRKEEDFKKSTSELIGTRIDSSELPTILSVLYWLQKKGHKTIYNEIQNALISGKVEIAIDILRNFCVTSYMSHELIIVIGEEQLRSWSTDNEKCALRVRAYRNRSGFTTEFARAHHLSDDNVDGEANFEQCFSLWSDLNEIYRAGPQSTTNIQLFSGEYTKALQNLLREEYYSPGGAYSEIIKKHIPQDMFMAYVREEEARERAVLGYENVINMQEITSLAASSNSGKRWRSEFAIEQGKEYQDMVGDVYIEKVEKKNKKIAFSIILSLEPVEAYFDDYKIFDEKGSIIIKPCLSLPICVFLRAVYQNGVITSKSIKTRGILSSLEKITKQEFGKHFKRKFSINTTTIESQQISNESLVEFSQIILDTQGN